MQTVSEKTLENNLINQLTNGEINISHWTYRPDLKTEDDLWANFFTKLQNHNLDKLNDVMLTASEKYQIKNQLSFGSFYEAAQWLSGENGIARVDVIREDASLGTARLVVFNRAEVAGGNSTYEVANQIQVLRRDVIDADSRFDVTLLINSIPMIQIELKTPDHAYMDAFKQIKKYLNQGKFSGIFSMVQMFVVTNSVDTKYIASASGENLDEQFLSGWSDVNNKPVTNYLEFAQSVLSIPQAHKMVAQYTVLDDKRKALILLRPYQIHAIEAVRDASRNQKSGYVWHTTGSGKTLTAYKVATDLLDIPAIDKTIFIIDRIDLDQQTTSSFTAYSENDMRDVDDTDNVSGLIERLSNSSRNVVITTIQKLNYVMRRFEANPDNQKLNKIRNLKIAFVVDECHRAVSALKQQEIQNFFRDSLWYGFTGTPIFSENAKQAHGDLARTTQEQYGNLLHQYTVKEAIHDKSVLGFQVEYLSTFTNDELDLTLKKDPKFRDDLSKVEKESLIPKQTFLDEKHMWEVVDAIVNHSEGKLNLHAGRGQAFEGILTTTSISQAQRYYEMFQEVIAGTGKVKVKNRIKEKLPDFPKVAITYSVDVSENNDDTAVNLDRLKASLIDYNKMFDTHFTLDSIKNYNSNLNDRLARKSDRYRQRKNQLDLVIVVDRLLTGFDAPCVSTLFVDRPPMQPHNLIQAFSRTNRLFSAKKTNGRIVTFQTPAMFELAVRDAFALYSSGGETSVLAPTFAEAKALLKQKITNFHGATKRIEDVDSMTLSEKKMFVRAYQELDKALTDIVVYADFDEDKFEDDYDLKLDSFQELKGKYENVFEDIKSDSLGLTDNYAFDIEYQLSSVRTDDIDYQYILSLLQNFAATAKQRVLSDNEIETREIQQHLDELKQTNPLKARLIEEILEILLVDSQAYGGKKISLIYEESKQAHIKRVTHMLADEYALNETELEYVLLRFRDGIDLAKQDGMSNLINDCSDFKAYKAMHPTDTGLLKYLYNNKVREAIGDIWQKEIRPLVKE